MNTHMPHPARVTIVFGTRPEAIKLAPVIHALRSQEHITVHLVVTAQHREMLDQVLATFHLLPDEDLDIMQPHQTLPELTTRLIPALDKVLKRHRADALIVQGDTTTTLAAALVSHYHQVPLGHIEAGLRTNQRYSPFPEEMNRRLVTQLATWHFAPTPRARDNLLREGVAADRIIITGNTVIDAQQYLYQSDFSFADTVLAPLETSSQRIILLTTHRRENFGAPMRKALTAIRQLVDEHPDVLLIFPVHLNPQVQRTTHECFGGHERINLVEPVDYRTFIHLLARSHLIFTDSGGIQEEAPSFDIPVLVMRDSTERPEGIQAGTAILVGTNPERIIAEGRRLLQDTNERGRRDRIANPFGDGHAATRIASFVAAQLVGANSPAR